MKFVLFNIAVIAALIFLFNADRADFRAWADRAYATVGLARATAEDVTEKAGQTAKDPETPSLDTAEPAPKEQDEVAVAETPQPAEPQAETPPVQTLDPAVAQRRAEVLGIEASPQPVSVTGETDQLMTPEQRRRELFTLAEEMELFYVQRLNR